MLLFSLLRARVCRCGRMYHRICPVFQQGDAKIADLRAALPGKEDVRRLDVPVDDEIPMRRIQTACHIRRDPQRLGRREHDGRCRIAFGTQAVMERTACTEFHDQVEHAVAILDEIVHGDDVVVYADASERLRFAAEAVPPILILCELDIIQLFVPRGIALRLRDREADCLDRPIRLEARVECLDDDPHRAFGEYMFDTIAVEEQRGAGNRCPGRWGVAGDAALALHGLAHLIAAAADGGVIRGEDERLLVCRQGLPVARRRPEHVSLRHIEPLIAFYQGDHRIVEGRFRLTQREGDREVIGRGVARCPHDAIDLPDDCVRWDGEMVSGELFRDYFLDGPLVEMAAPSREGLADDFFQHAAQQSGEESFQHRTIPNHRVNANKTARHITIDYMNTACPLAIGGRQDDHALSCVRPQAAGRVARAPSWRHAE